MFNIVKQNVNLLEEIEKDLSVTFKQIGSENWEIDGEAVESCPFCGHHKCFRVRYVEGDNAGAFYKCFSCSEYGDVITWRSKHKEISMRDAAIELAKEHNLKLPNDYNPVQEVFTAAANYYAQCLQETCNRKFALLGGKTPKAYQMEIRCHKEETLKEFQIGYSDGGLVEYLESIGIDNEVIDASGLKNSKGKDYLPTNCFIYPHYAKGRVSHFTFKDPLKKAQYQVKKVNSLNGYIFYGQDTISKTDTVVLVEGENDLLSVAETGMSKSTLATIGTLSRDQIEWLKINLAGKRVITIFDPDEAGDKYRQSIEAIRGAFKTLAHVLPPDGKDIDQHLCEGADIEKLILANFVTVKLEEPKKRNSSKEPEPSPLAIQWDVVDPQPPEVDLPKVVIGGYTPPAALSNLGQPVKTIPDEDRENELEPLDNEDGSLLENAGCYWKVKKNKDAADTWIRVSDFTVKLCNIFTDESMQRTREIVLIRRDGSRSDPFLVNSETKVSPKVWAIQVANMGECEWLGKEPELAGMWRRVLAKSNVAEIFVPRRVGKNARSKGWIFRNVFISDSGGVVLPDDDGVFWLNETKTKGLRPQGLTESEDPIDKLKSVPELNITLSREETDALTKTFIEMLSANLGDVGQVLMALGWFWANVHSDTIFKLNGGMGIFLLWGLNGGGKTTVVKWMHRIFGFEDQGYTQVGQLKTAVGFQRQGEYYSSLPMILDEVRNDDPTREALPLIRSWYDRSTRVMGTKDAHKTQERTIRSNLFLTGEDIPEDPATKERCVSSRVTEKNREKLKSYAWCQDNKEKFSAIGYQWIVDSMKEDPVQIAEDIRRLDKELMDAGCTARISKNWAMAGYFGKRLADKFVPKFDFVKYMKDECKAEYEAQKSESHLEAFLNYFESAADEVHNDLTDVHFRRSGDEFYVAWFGTYNKIAQINRGDPRFKFSRFQVKNLLQEQNWCVNTGTKSLPKRAMGNHGRKEVLIFDLKKAPEQIRNIARMTEPMPE